MHRARVTAQLICPPLVWPVAQPSTMIVLPNVSATANVHAGPRANLQSDPGGQIGSALGARPSIAPPGIRGPLPVVDVAGDVSVVRRSAAADEDCTRI